MQKKRFPIWMQRHNKSYECSHIEKIVYQVLRNVWWHRVFKFIPIALKLARTAVCVCVNMVQNMVIWSLHKVYTHKIATTDWVSVSVYVSHLHIKYAKVHQRNRSYVLWRNSPHHIYTQRHTHIYKQINP